MYKVVCVVIMVMSLQAMEPHRQQIASFIGQEVPSRQKADDIFSYLKQHDVRQDEVDALLSDAPMDVLIYLAQRRKLQSAPSCIFSSFFLFNKPYQRYIRYSDEISFDPNDYFTLPTPDGRGVKVTAAALGGRDNHHLLLGYNNGVVRLLSLAEVAYRHNRLNFEVESLTTLSSGSDSITTVAINHMYPINCAFATEALKAYVWSQSSQSTYQLEGYSPCLSFRQFSCLDYCAAALAGFGLSRDNSMMKMIGGCAALFAAARRLPERDEQGWKYRLPVMGFGEYGGFSKTIVAVDSNVVIQGTDSDDSVIHRGVSAKGLRDSIRQHFKK